MSLIKKQLAVLLSCLLVAMLLPVGTSAAFADDEQSLALSSWSEGIPALLAGGEYSQGEALVIMTEQEGASRGRSVDLLSSAESLMDVTSEAYDVGVAEAGERGDTAASRSSVMTLGAGNDDESSLVIKLVQRSDMSTEELLYALAEDSRVLRAEPNYFSQVSEEVNKLEVEQSADKLAEVGDAKAEGVQADESADDVAPNLAEENSASTKTSTFFVPTGEVVDTEDKTSKWTDYQWAFNNSRNSPVMTDPARSDGFTINLSDWNKRNSINSDKNQVVAIMDSGVDYTHPDLNGVMADMSRYANLGFGQFGANVVAKGGYTDKTNPMDDNSHGTHVAGIVASQWNDFGTSGVANGVKLTAIKAGNAAGIVFTADVINGYGMLSKAVDGGLDLIAVNNSWGGRGFSAMLSTAVAALGKKGVVSVFASGNENVNTDIVSSSTSSLLNNPYAVVVNSSTMAGKRSSFSNYGVATTNVFAPGSDIMSTYPTKLGTFMPTADDDTLAYESFETATPTVSIHKPNEEKPFDVESAPIGTRSTDMHFDEAGSWLVKSEDFKNEKGHSLTFKIPINKDDVDRKMHRVGLNVFSSGESLMGGFTLEGEDGKGGKEYFDFTQFTNISLGWNRISLDIDKMLKENEGYKNLVYHTDENGSYVAVTLGIGSMTGATPPSFELYLDNISIGYQTTGYGMMSGTSMATPMVTGAAAVQTKRVGQVGSKAERARLVAATLNGAVTPDEKFSEMCTSGGQITLAADASKIPVINSASTLGEAGSVKIALSGFFFNTTQGTVKIAGKDATVKSWGDREIVVDCPQGLLSGVHEIQVTNNGQMGRKTLLLTIPANPGEGVPLFEETIALPDDGFAEKSSANKMIGLGGKMYVMPGADDLNDTTMPVYGDMWCYNPTTMTWAQVASMPERVDCFSTTLYDGKIMVLGRTGSSLEKNRLFSYDPLSNAWTTIEGIQNIPLGAALVNSAGSLVLVGGATAALHPTIPDTLVFNMIEKDNIAVFDLSTKTVTPVGTLKHPRALLRSIGDLKVAAYGSDIYVTGGIDYSGSGKLVSAMEYLVKTDQGYQPSEIDNLLPKLATEQGYNSNYGLTTAKTGPVIAGVNALSSAEGADTKTASTLAPNDTYTLDASNKDSKFVGIGKRVSYSVLDMPAAHAYNGKLYVMGGTAHEPGVLVMRAMSMDTLPQPGDIVSPVKPVPTPSDKPLNKLASTGDNGVLLITALVLGGLAAVGAISTACFRMRKKK